MSKCIRLNVGTTVGWVLAVIGLVTVGLVLATAIPVVWGLAGLVVLKGAAVIYLARKLESIVDRVVAREVGGLIEREIAAYHLGRSRAVESAE